jgi:hypothetical protein
MLVTFHTKSYADITLFGDIAVQLLKSMGHSGDVPGALLADDIPGALAKLRASVAAAPPPPTPPGGNDDDDERPVSLANRALPLIQLLQAALADGENVMWD